MSVELIPLTKEGYDSLHKELEHLKQVERPQIIAAIAEARGHGDLKENAEYHAAREKQGYTEARINDLEEKLSRSEVVLKPTKDFDKVRFGASVTLTDEETGEIKKYQLVGDLEADIAKNKLSISSPMGKALLGKKEGDLVRIKAPKGDKEYVIDAIEY